MHGAGPATLILIYGPPAVGKYTVGKALAERARCKFFHNHLSLECVRAVFDLNHPSCIGLVGMIRFEILAEAARLGVRVVFTYGYTKGTDDVAMLALIRLFEDAGGRVCLVQLTCARSALEKRVSDASRAAFGKITQVTVLREHIAKAVREAPIPHRPSLKIDTTNLAPAEAAEMIVKHYRL